MKVGFSPDYEFHSRHRKWNLRDDRQRSIDAFSQLEI